MVYFRKFIELFKTHFLFVIFTLFYFIFVLLSYKSFPITADEKFRYQRGQEQLSNFLNSTPDQSYIYPSKEADSYYFYGVILNFLNPNFYYEWFHLQNMVFAFVAFISIYLLVYEYTKNPKFSVLGPVFLFLTPGFSGHVASAPIDMPFASFFLLCLYLIFKFRNDDFSFKKVLVLGFAFWPVLAIRPIGFEFFLIFLVVTLFLSDRKFNKVWVIENIKSLFLIFIVSNFLLVITWPYLGLNYFKNIFNILLVTSSYDKWDNLILFAGDLISKEQRPWDYLFHYLFLTTPLFILVLSVCSIFFIKKTQKLKILVLFVISLNIGLYLFLNPVIYNGLRHFIFLIPLIVVLAVIGLWDLYKSEVSKYLKYLIFGISFISLIWTSFEITKLFPVHYAYFNELSGGVEKNIDKYETDYWGASYKYAAIYVRDSFKEKQKVYSCNLGFGVDYYMDKKHEVLIDSEEADLIICDVVMDRQRGYRGEVIHKIPLGNQEFIYIRKSTK